MERISTVLLEALHISGYVNPISVCINKARTPHGATMNLSSDDAELWLGMYRQILWKVNKERKKQRSETTPFSQTSRNVKADPPPA